MAKPPGYPSPQATTAVMNISAASVVASTACILVGFSVVGSGAVGAIYDAAATGATANRMISAIPVPTNFYLLNWPCTSGVVVVPGAGQVVALTLA